MDSCILFRLDSSNTEEFKVACKYFSCTKSRSLIISDELVIPRYSLWPFPKELEDDIKYQGGKLINSTFQIEYISDLKNYVADLGNLTPRTWNRLEYLPEDGGPYILKGATNSKKFNWKTHMFAKNKQEAIEVHGRLCQDGLIGSQDIYIREYVPLKTYYLGLQDLPVTEEYRFFVCYGEVISGGFYWSDHIETIREMGEEPNPNQVPREFLQEVIDKVGRQNNFYVIDVARTAKDDWIVIELNCGEMSGLSENDPDVLYSNLRDVLIRKGTK